MLLAAISDFASPAIAAIAALAGTYVGGRNLARVEERRQRHQDVRERRLEARLVRSVARAHGDDLHRASTVAAAALIMKRWPRRGEHRLARDIPNSDRLLLARHLTLESWEKLSEAHLQADVVVLATEAERGNPIPDNECTMLQNAITLFEEARSTLRSLEAGARSEEESIELGDHQ